MVIRQNISALRTWNNLKTNTKATKNSLEKLSSGLKINKAADDAAGLAISEKMKAMIGGLDKASDNIENGISMIQSADGTLGNVQSILQKLNKISVEAKNGTLNSCDKAHLQDQADALEKSLDQVISGARFNTSNIFGNSNSTQLFSENGLGIQTGSEDGQTVSLNLNNTVPAQWVAVENYEPGKGGQQIVTTGPLSNQTEDRFFQAVYSDDGGNLSTPVNVSVTSAGLSGTISVSGVDFEISDAYYEKAVTDSDGNTSYVKTAVTDSAFSGGSTSLSGVHFQLKDPNTGNVFSGDATRSATVTCPPGTLTFGSNINTLVLRENFSAEQAVQVGDKSFTAHIAWHTPLQPGADASQTAESYAFFTLSDSDGNYVKEPVYDSNGRYTGVSDAPINFANLVGFYSKTGVLIDDGLIQQNAYLVLRKVAALPDDDSKNLYLSSTDSTALNVSYDDGEIVHRLAIESDASTAMIKNAIDGVSSFRSKLGAYQNELSHSNKYITNERENLTAAESTITDADMAKEMMTYTKISIITQAAQAMLTQANQLPQGVLSLLKQ